MSQSSTPFPYRDVAMVCSISFASGITFSGLFPYAGFMVVDLMNTTTDKAGYYAGLLASSAMFGRACTSVPWGVAADTYGRKPALISGLLSIVICSVVFGCSVNIYMAVIARFVMGLFNPIIGIAKTLVSEVCPREHEAMGMGALTGTWGIGLILGPAFGGMLSNPTTPSSILYPLFRTYAEADAAGQLYHAHAVDDGSLTYVVYKLLVQFPYLLPNLVTALYALVDLIIVLFYFKETLKKKTAPAQQQQQPASDSKVGAASSAIEMVPTTDSSRNTNSNSSTVSNGGKGGSSRRGTYRSLKGEDGGENDAAERTNSPDVESSSSSSQETCNGDKSSLNLLPVVNEKASTSTEKGVAGDGSKSSADTGESNFFYQMFTVPRVRKVIFVYFICSLNTIIYDEVLPLWALSSPARGGLSFTAPQIGTIMSYTGAGLVLYTITIYPLLAKHLGPRRSFVYGLMIAVPFFISVSFISHLMPHEADAAVSPSHYRLIYALLVINNLIVRMATNLSFASIALLINRSVDMSHRASVNGVAMTIGSSARTIGPALGGTIFAWSIDGGGGKSSANSVGGGGEYINYHLVFFLIALSSFLCSCLMMDESDENDDGKGGRRAAPPATSSSSSGSSDVAATQKYDQLPSTDVDEDDCEQERSSRQTDNSSSSINSGQTDVEAAVAQPRQQLPIASHNSSQQSPAPSPVRRQ